MGRAEEVLAALRRDPGSALVAVDFDGTLAPIVARPEDSRLTSGAREVLASLAARVATVAVVTGRPAADVVRLGELSATRGLLVLGHYGMQRWHDGRLETPDPAPGVDVARDRLPGLLQGAAEGVVVEDKDHSLVVHTRRAEDPQGTLDELSPSLVELAGEVGLEAVPGRYVLELRPPGVDKGTALRALIAQRATRTAVYIGDDLGDLPAFDAVEELRDQGGLGLTVASAGDPDAPAAVGARADLVLPGPAAVVGWLERLLG